VQDTAFLHATDFMFNRSTLKISQANPAKLRNLGKINLNSKHMILYSHIAQVLIALSIVIIWVFRFYKVEKEFKLYELSDLTRNMVGASKISLSTLLVAGIWFPDLVLVPALIMAALMVAAQYFHFKLKHPFLYHVPSLILLLLSLFIAAVSLKYI
jgi:hypothetical protein